MKKKWIALLLSVTLIIAGAAPAYAAEFSDGTSGTEISNDFEIITNASSDFTDSAPKENGFVSEEGGMPAAEEAIPVIDDLMNSAEAASVEGKIYTINFEGKLVLDQTQEFVRLLNIEREKLGVPPVQIDQQMMEKAIKRAPEVAVYYDHVNPETGEETNMTYGVSAECISGGHNDAKGFLDSLKNSPPHWGILTDKDCIRFGAAICDDYFVSCQVGTDWGEYVPYKGTFTNRKEFFTQKIRSDFFGKLNGEDCTYTLLDVGERTHCQIIYKNTMDGERVVGGMVIDSIHPGGIWKSLTPDIVSVDQNGTVTALAPGDGVVRYYLEEGSNEFDEELFEVREKEEYVPALPAPKVTASVSGYKNVKLTWKKVPDAIGYEVYRYNGKGYQRIKKLTGISSTSFIDKIGYGKTAQYKVRAYGYIDGWLENGKFSSVKTIKTAPAAPSIAKLSNSSKGKLKLTWKRPSGAEKYQIYRKTGANGTYKRIKTITSSKTLTYTDSKLRRGTTYYYKVRAYRKGADGKSVYSKWSKVVKSTCR